MPGVPPAEVGIPRAAPPSDPLGNISADTFGNIGMEREALTLEVPAIAMVAHNSGGVVIRAGRAPSPTPSPCTRRNDGVGAASMGQRYVGWYEIKP
jgi:hypothetical protein